MKILRVVKLALLISIVVSGSKAWAFSNTSNFDCGVYRVQGILRLANNVMFILQVQPNSSSPYDLIILGGSTRGKLRFVGSTVELEVYINQPLRDNSKPFANFRSWQPLSLKRENAAVKIRNEACGEAAKLSTPPTP